MKTQLFFLANFLFALAFALAQFKDLMCYERNQHSEFNTFRTNLPTG